MVMMTGILLCQLLEDLGSKLSADENRSDTASVSSSIFEYVEENGRTYHRYKQGSECTFDDYIHSLIIASEYLLPNDLASLQLLSSKRSVLTVHDLRKNKKDWVSWFCSLSLTAAKAIQTSNINYANCLFTEDST